MDKTSHLQLFFERLQAAPAFSTRAEAYSTLCEILNAVEDEHSGVIFNPDNWEADGRLYPPQSDRSYPVDGFPELIRYKSFAHNTFIAINGAVEVKSVTTNEIYFSKLGANGKGVWE